MINSIIMGNALEAIPQMRGTSVDMCMTSPPYWQARKYSTRPVLWSDGWSGELGQEPDKDMYVAHLCDIFDAVFCVLKDTGSCWVNIGDMYRNKELCQIPSLFAIEMSRRGWKLRNEIIWHKPSAMPHSVKDRFLVDYEKLFFFVKQDDYYFNQQFEPASITNKESERFERLLQVPETREHIHAQLKRVKRSVWTMSYDINISSHLAPYPVRLAETPIMASCPIEICNQCGRPTVTRTVREKYGRAQYHSKYQNDNLNSGKSILQKRCALREMSRSRALELYPDNKQLQLDYIRLMHAHGSGDAKAVKMTCDCNMGFHPGVVLDPFIGSGTTAIAAKKCGVNYVGIEMNEEYAKIAQERIANYVVT